MAEEKKLTLYEKTNSGECGQKKLTVIYDEKIKDGHTVILMRRGYEVLRYTDNAFIVKEAA